MSESSNAGAMQSWALTTDKFLEHAAKWHADREIVSRTAADGIVRTNYGAVHAGAKRLSNALRGYGIRQGDRVATLAMNTAAHLQSWYAITGIGSICHTLNPRLSADQLTYIVDHAEDRLILADAAFAPLLSRLLPRTPSVERVVYLDRPPADVYLDVPAGGLDDFTRGADTSCIWGAFDEGLAAGLCYTSGTTGRPKGVLYSHRSNFLHTLTTLQADVFGFSVRDVIMPVVPMYHANAWAMSFSAPAVGAKLVLPGASLLASALHELVQSEGVTVAAGVPTVWLGYLEWLAQQAPASTTLKRVIVGGAACPERLVRTFDALGIEVIHAWGMTEMSPVGGACSLPPEIAGLPPDQQMPWRIKQGRSPCGVDLKLLGRANEILPHDGETAGRLLVRGPGVVARYYRAERDSLEDDGYFDTGDIATIDAFGFMRITDRAKDMIKSGGEWISSIDIEKAVLLHDDVAMAAVVGRPDPKWGERPVLYLQLHAGRSGRAEDFRAFLRSRIASWCVPDTVIFTDGLPLGSTGKVDKQALRERTVAASHIEDRLSSP
jgi:fatty-acyl-CoA synthase